MNLNEKTKNYVSVEGKLCGYSAYDSDGESYSLEYEYIVDGRKYYISTNYGVGVIPELGSVKTIKYNLNNPSEAIIAGAIVADDSNVLWIVLGFMFFFIALIMVMSESGKKSKKAKKIKSLITSGLIGILFSGLGISAYYMMCMGTDSLSLATGFKLFGTFAIIPVIFIILGILIMLMSIFPKKEKVIILKVENITECNNDNYTILLVDKKINKYSIQSMTNKYYVYNTKNKEKFEIGKEFKVNIYKYGMMHEAVNISQTVLAKDLAAFEDSDFNVI